MPATSIPPNSTSGPVIILDNGGGDIKACVIPRALIGSGSKRRSDGGKLKKERVSLQAQVFPNALAKPGAKAICAPASVIGRSRRPAGYLVAREIFQAPDMTAMTLRRPHDRGFISSFDTERDVWASVFSEDRGIGVNADLRKTSSLILTEAIGVPLRVRRATDQLVYETFGFHSCAVAPAARLSAGVIDNKKNRNTAIVLDTGFSSSTTTPIVNGREVAHAARRLALGGKALTNLLKQTVSFRSWNMSDEIMVMTAVKERCCYLAPYSSPSSIFSYAHLMENVRPISYLLPDSAAPGYTGTLGRICPDDYEPDPQQDQVLPLRNERLATPEALFHPSDIGVPQAGLHELVVQAVDACQAIMADENIKYGDLKPDLFANVLLTGGNCKFPGFYQRFVDQLRPLVPGDYDLSVHMEDDPVLTPFNGAVQLLAKPNPPLDFITRNHYLENGTDAILRELYGDADDNG